MAAENRCQGFYWLRIYHLTDGAICAPPRGKLVKDPDIAISDVYLTRSFIRLNTDTIGIC